jgi:hypothetical protein
MKKLFKFLVMSSAKKHVTNHAKISAQSHVKISVTTSARLDANTLNNKPLKLNQSKMPFHVVTAIARNVQTVQIATAIKAY